MPAITPRWKRYPAYEDSGVEWLGEIPAGWRAKRLKFVAAGVIKNGVGEAGAYDNPEWPRYVRITDIAGPRELREDTFKSLPPELAREAAFEAGDLLLAAVGATFGKSYLHVRDCGPVCFAGYMVRFSPGREVQSSFAAYWTESSSYWALARSRVVQATIQNFSAAKYKELVIPLPSVPEQKAIATFLDRETARIDALVGKKERLIELLQEKRTALITRVVTKGLDPNVTMKDSGVEWLGEIPAHWEVKPNGALFHERDERGREDLPILEVSIASGVRVRQFSDTKIEQRSDDLGSYKVARTGDISFNKMRMWQGAVGAAPDDGLVSPDYIVAYPGAGTVSDYYASVFRIPLYMSEVYRRSHGIVDDRNRLYWDDFKAIRSPVPSYDEQRTIAAFLDQETSRIDALVGKVRDAINRLKELRTALISAAVTGKIDVREEVA